MTPEDDTIAAVATGPGEAGISIVRMSGPRCLEIADRVFRCTSPSPSGRSGGTFVYGHVAAPAPEKNGAVTDIDEAILLIYRAPHSYTREDVVEIQGHGGLVCARRILRVLLDAGARSAEPGEFTKRAFMNGRIDLTQAEAVLDLVRASSDRAAAAAVEQLSGVISTWCATTYDKLIKSAADLEASLDFADDELPALDMGQIEKATQIVFEDIRAMLATWGEGHVLREGALVVISGRPNVGKSTLFNALLGTDRAIVTQHPGTTRDTIEENLILDGVPIRLVDTAGLRNTDCDIEREGIQRTRTHMGKADLHIYVVDASLPPTEADRKELAELPASDTVLVLNKIDLGMKTSPADIGTDTAVMVSSADGQGVDNLKTTLASKLRHYVNGPAKAVISERHRQIILAVSEDVEEALRLLGSHREDMAAPAASLLRSAAESLAELTGAAYHKDLLDQIFSRFCIGK